jgi:hypothetical protein
VPDGPPASKRELAFVLLPPGRDAKRPLKTFGGRALILLGTGLLAKPAAKHGLARMSVVSIATAHVPNLASSDGRFA